MLGETFVMILFFLVLVMPTTMVMAIIGHAIIKALARNPSSASKLFMGMVILLIFVLAFSIVALLVLFQLFAK